MIFAQAKSDGWACAMAAVVLGLMGVSMLWKMLRADARRVRQCQVNRDARDVRRRGFDPILKPADPPPAEQE